MSTYRIPSSLKWLIKNHQTILGRLNQTQKELKEVERYLDHAKEIIEQNAQLNMLIEVKSKSCCKFTLSNPSQLTN